MSRQVTPTGQNSIFLNRGAISRITSGIGVIVFTGLTAYDTWKIKALAAQRTQGRKPALLGALTLYLDFSNLFLTLLIAAAGIILHCRFHKQKKSENRAERQ